MQQTIEKMREFIFRYDTLAKEVEVFTGVLNLESADNEVFVLEKPLLEKKKRGRPAGWKKPKDKKKESKPRISSVDTGAVALRLHSKKAPVSTEGSKTRRLRVAYKSWRRLCLRTLNSKSVRGYSDLQRTRIECG